MARASKDPQNFDPTAVLGLTGLKRFAGRVYEEFLPELTGSRGRKVIKEMTSQDPIIGAIRKTFELLLRQVSWDVQDFDESSEAQMQGDFLREVMDDMSRPWVEVIIEALSMLDYGWEYSEIAYKLRKGDSLDPTKRSKFTDGKWGWRKIDTRAQDTLWKWEFDEEGGVQGMWQMAPPHYKLVYLPIEKALLFRTTSRKGNPEGESIYRNAYRPWYFKKHIENLEGVGIERDLAGLPMLKVPGDLLDPNASPDKKAALAAWQKVMTAVKRDEQEGLIVPSDRDDGGNALYEFSLVTSGGTRQFDTNGIVNRKNQEMAMSCLADVVLLGHENVGSFALADTKKSTLTTAMGSFLDIEAEVFNTHAIPRLWKLNGWPTDKLPKIIHGDIEAIDLTELGAFITALAGAGAPLFPNPDLQSYLMEAAGLPTPQEGMDAASGKPRVKPNLPADLDPDGKETGGDDEEDDEAEQLNDPSGENLESGPGGAQPPRGTAEKRAQRKAQTVEHPNLALHLHEASPAAPAAPDHTAAFLEVAKSMQEATEKTGNVLSRMVARLRKEQPITVEVNVPPAQIAVQNAGDVHVSAAPAAVTIKNDVHVPAQAAPVVIVPTEPASKLEVQYEVGPDGRSRPKSMTRS